MTNKHSKALSNTDKHNLGVRSMKNYKSEELSFEALGKRELLKGPVWWLGLAATVTAAAYLYCQQTLDN